MRINAAKRVEGNVPDANGVYAVLKLSKSDSYGFGEL